MKLYVRGPVSSYEFENLTRLFYPGAQIVRERTAERDENGRLIKENCVVVRVAQSTAQKIGARLAVAVRLDGRVSVSMTHLKNKGKAEYETCCLLYHLLRDLTGIRPPWGMLTGVRPVRLVHARLNHGQSIEEAARDLRDTFDVSEEKLNLAVRTAQLQRPVVQAVQPKDYSLYISIPFCPSRCSYCSFVSRTIENSKDLIQPYVEALCRELESISNQAQHLGLRLRTVYMGGGTPTSLTAPQLRRVMQCIRDYFPVDTLEEYTVEAGRPDCTDAEKLQVMKELGADRISINPQSLDDGVLQAIGRRHTAQDVLDCFETARKIGHENINMDLIAGLPTDTVEGFRNTLRQILALRPENITVHTLTLKRASNLVIEERAAAYDDVSAMVSSCSAVTGAGYDPYYLYRQKGTLQNLENTGFCLPGREGLYNIYIMEELHSIFSAGAGGVTKLIRPGSSKIERIFNFKYPLEYVRDFDTMLKKKEGVEAFYGSSMDT